MRIFIVFIALVFSSGSAFAQVSDAAASKARTKATQAQQYLKQWRYPKAIDKYTEAIDLDSTRVDFLKDRGDVFMQMEKFDRAKEDYSLAIRRDSTFGLGYLGMADWYATIDSKNDTLDWFLEMALENCAELKDQAEALATAGRVRFIEGDFKEAEHFISAALRLDGENKKSRFLMSNIFFEMNKREEAVGILEELVKEDKNNMEYLITLGYAYCYVEKYQESAKILERALFYEPDNPYALANMSLTRLRQNRNSEANKLVDRSLNIDPSNPYAHYVKGLLYIAEDKNQKACKSFNKAMDRVAVLHERSFVEIQESMEEHCGTDLKTSN